MGLGAEVVVWRALPVVWSGLVMLPGAEVCRWLGCMVGHGGDAAEVGLWARA
jgi:hypothetical protein